MESLLITVLKQGSIAFFGSKLTKVLNEREISEIIAAGGWAIVGLSALKSIIPIIKGIENISNKLGNVANKMGEIADKIDIFNLFN